MAKFFQKLDGTLLQDFRVGGTHGSYLHNTGGGMDLMHANGTDYGLLTLQSATFVEATSGKVVSLGVNPATSINYQLMFPVSPAGVPLSWVTHTLSGDTAGNLSWVDAILAPATAPTDGQIPAFDLASGSMVWSTPASPNLDKYITVDLTALSAGTHTAVTVANPPVGSIVNRIEIRLVTNGNFSLATTITDGVSQYLNTTNLGTIDTVGTYIFDCWGEGAATVAPLTLSGVVAADIEVIIHYSSPL